MKRLMRSKIVEKLPNTNPTKIFFFTSDCQKQFNSYLEKPVKTSVKMKHTD